MKKISIVLSMNIVINVSVTQQQDKKPVQSPKLQNVAGNAHPVKRVKITRVQVMDAGVMG